MPDSPGVGEFGILPDYDQNTTSSNPIQIPTLINISIHTFTPSLNCPRCDFGHSVIIAQPERDLLRDIHTLGFILVPEKGSELWWPNVRHMATETGYGIQKLRPIHARTPDLVSLRQWESLLKGQWRRTFEGKYGNLLGLLEIKVQPEALLALTQYYDPPLNYFTFRDF
ncbi:hypothetical protein CR513_02728, partial [Mucuna pruriens]